jgi:hypothetical protein
MATKKEFGQAVINADLLRTVINDDGKIGLMYGTPSVSQHVTGDMSVQIQIANRSQTQSLVALIEKLKPEISTLEIASIEMWGTLFKLTGPLGDVQLTRKLLSMIAEKSGLEIHFNEEKPDRATLSTKASAPDTCES